MHNVYNLTGLTDEELLEESLHSPSAFEILISRYQRTFLERAEHVVKSRDEAEDIVQEAFIRIYRFATKFQGEEGSFKAWGMTILMNVARTRYQKKVKERSRIAPLEDTHYESLAAPSEVDAVYAKDIVERALETAPEEVARILQLAYIDELPYQEIAEREGISVGAVKTRVHRAKKLLQGIIGTI